MIPFFEEADVAVTICDREGRIIEMNEQSRQVNLKPGQSLIVYTITKGDKKKLIYQIPWYENGEYAGFMELSMIIPHEMAHYVRQVPPEKKA